MTARALWLWLHEAVYPIPNGQRTLVRAPHNGPHFMNNREGDMSHEVCFLDFAARLRDRLPIFPPYAPPIVHDMERRAREEWNGEVG